ncbi:putative mitochondrial chaperone bcs1 [Talaromyces proteolyticus]|uniref:Mitochondrial chaperone bcs1 n=1 Tax=Talaromyces proteolyticus TaxID=1131652 RepID=A0AAD4PY28_9EURO|nr:putative mitochondrial chaperone bcs1 [Talaromyces proteolyticus]KAH8693954.1 putative mitochondrial chaperone bcs1 [Talaromyces proteolyticus]
MSSLPLPREATKLLKPAYLHIFSLVQNTVDLDPLTLVNIGIFLAGLFTFLRYIFTRVIVLWTTVRINDDDPLYGYLMRWMADHQFMNRQFRSVKAVSSSRSSWEDEEEALKSMIGIGGDKELSEPDPNNLISYRSIVGRTPVSLQPFQGTHVFRRHGSWLLFQHKVHQGNELVQLPKERGYLQLKCLGSSFVPVQCLLEEAQLYNLERTKTTTTIHRAIANVRDHVRWTQFSSRPSRDISTVIFDKKAKHELLKDINEYLHPHTRRWYSNHGIPYRRGYLFSGAPGTGKTSLTSALAGIFGLDIYVLSLLDPNMNESQLMRLMSEVPSRCIVLLEDVDAAGLNRRESEPRTRQTRRNKGDQSAEADVVNMIQGSTGASLNNSANSAATSVSLSGLLNAIDGVSSQEGRILIMTTNSPESLDKALVRPGRVDMHIRFELPSREEMQELFLSMYREDIPALTRAVEKSQQREKYPDLDTLAEKFATAIPEKQLSLATLQGFLLQFKKNPTEACETAAKWAEQTIKRIAEEDEQREAMKERS